MLKDCEKAVKAAVERIGDRAVIGIHTHNDCGLAVANSLVAVVLICGIAWVWVKCHILILHLIHSLPPILP